MKTVISKRKDTRLQRGDVPVVIFIHRRHRHLQKVLCGIRKYRPAKVFCFADAWEKGNENEKNQCLQARATVRAGIDWPCRLEMRCSLKKLGLKKNVETGLTHVFRKVPQAIVLEDDCVPTREFFRFCEEGLRDYKNDPNIMSISGSCFLSAKRRVNASAYLSRYPHCWGWATWRRAWKRYSSHYPANTMMRILEKQKLGKEEKRHWLRVIQQMQSRQISSWAYLWMFAHWQMGARSLNPTSNLVKNIGFDSSAENTRDIGRKIMTRSNGDIFNQLLELAPEATSRDWDREVFINHYKRLSGRLSLLEKIVEKLRKLLTSQ